MQRKGLEKIKHKKDILSFTLGKEYLDEYILGKENKLFKGKVHCSCSLCAAKTSTCGWKHRDLRELERISYGLSEFRCS